MRKFVRKADLFSARAVKVNPQFKDIKRGHFLVVEGGDIEKAIWVSLTSYEMISGWDKFGRVARLRCDNAVFTGEEETLDLKIVGYRQFNTDDLISTLQHVVVNLPDGQKTYSSHKET